MKDLHLLIMKKIELLNWFNGFYSPQVEQANRAARTGTEWTARYQGKVYNTIAELDADANAKQLELRALQTKIREMEVNQ